MENNYQLFDSRLKKESGWVVVYFFLYFASLFFTLENEWTHWLTLVILPSLLIILYRIKAKPVSFKEALHSLGIQNSNLRIGIFWALLLGMGFSAFQLMFSRENQKQWEIFYSGKVVYLFPLAFLLLSVTAGFTEEFFFRGVLQTRLAALFNSNFWGVIVGSALFGLYHLPYAYLNPNWPSHGNVQAAFASAFGQGLPIGLVLGFVYARSKNNLLSSIILHSLINVMPVMSILNQRWIF